MKLSKKLILNADDYGLCAEVNEAVEMIAEAGRLGGASILVNGKSFHQAIQFLNSHPEISAGIHLNLIEGSPSASVRKIKSLVGADNCFLGFRGLIRRFILHPFRVRQEIEIEWRTQIERLISEGVTISHADSHQHFHAFPGVYSIAVKLCEEYKIPALRLPNENRRKPLRGASSLAIRASLTTAQFITSTSKIKHNDHFLGFERAGDYKLNALLEDMKFLHEGVTELAVHPSLRDDFPHHGFHGRSELMAVLDNTFLATLQAEEIELTTWKRLSDAHKI